jgi:hypothetical protein
VMGSLIKNGDLRPDCNGFVSKRQAKDAFLCKGISGRVVAETTNANFDHLRAAAGCGAACTDSELRMNIFEMSTVSSGDANGRDFVTGAIEHFRSTGIRDSGSGSAGGVQLGAFGLFEGALQGSNTWTLTTALQGVNRWDLDARQPSSFAPPHPRVPASDTNIDQRPVGCGPTDGTPFDEVTVVDASQIAQTCDITDFGRDLV